MKHYILIGHELLEVSWLEWAAWMEKNRWCCRVANDQVTPEVRVSTIFLGLDHNFLPWGPPQLFETMVFGGALHHEQERYATWDEAYAGHQAILANVIEVEELERMK